MSSVVPQQRPVNELLGSLIDSNSFTISTRTHDDEERSEFQRNPSLHLNQQHNQSLPSPPSKEKSSSPLSRSNLKRLFSRPKIMNNRNNNNNNNNNNPQGVDTAIPIIQAEVIPESTNYAATPTDYFQYTSENIQNDNPVPTAPAFTTITDDSPSAQAHAVTWKTRFGSDMGRIQAVEEKETIKRVSANAKGFPYFESKRVEAADAIAKRRDREGFDVKIDKYFDESGLLVARRAAEAAAAAGKNNTSGGSGVKKSNDTQEGYQVAEYNTEEYDCKEYQTTEYKSVYD